MYLCQLTFLNKATVVGGHSAVVKYLMLYSWYAFVIKYKKLHCRRVGLTPKNVHTPSNSWKKCTIVVLSIIWILQICLIILLKFTCSQPTISQQQQTKPTADTFSSTSDYDFNFLWQQPYLLWHGGIEPFGGF